MNFSPYSNYGYASLIKETSEGVVPGIPNQYFRIVSESLSAAFANQEINEIAGDRERRQRSIQGQIEVGGDITIFVEEKMIGHFLRSIMGAPTTQTVIASTSYRHVFEVSNQLKTYTLDLQRADAPWAHRYFGVYFTSIEFTRSDNGIQATIACMPRKVFQEALVTTSANSGTTLLVDQTSGLHADDTILVLQKENGYTTVKELTVTTVDSETQLTVSTIDVQIDVGDIVVIKSVAEASITYNQCDPFQFMNGTVVATGNDIDNTTEFTVEDFSLTIANEVEARYGSGGNEINRYPYDMLTKGYTGEGSFTKYWDSEFFMSKARSNAKFPLRTRFVARNAISANSAQKASSVWGTTNGFKIEASTAGKAGNDIAVTIVINDTDDLAASISGNNVLIELANATASKNTGTLIASAVNALTGVDSTAEGTGAEQFTTAVSSTNLGFKSTGTNVVGADANEKPYLQIDLAHTILGEFSPNNEEDNIIPQEIPYMIFKDNDCENTQNKLWSTRIFLFNSVSSY
jgi:hypothetical protein